MRTVQHRRAQSALIQGPFCPIPPAPLREKRLRSGKYKLTAVGLEKFCARCQTDWPADTEFYFPMQANRDGLHEWCKACYCEWRWPERYQLAEAA